MDTDHRWHDPSCLYLVIEIVSFKIICHECVIVYTTHFFSWILQILINCSLNHTLRKDSSPCKLKLKVSLYWFVYKGRLLERCLWRMTLHYTENNSLSILQQILYFLEWKTGVTWVGTDPLSLVLSPSIPRESVDTDNSNPTILDPGTLNNIYLTYTKPRTSV